MSKVEAYKNLIRQFYAGSLSGDSKANFAQYLEDPEFLEAWEQLTDEQGLEDTSRTEPIDDELFDKIRSDIRITDEIRVITIPKEIALKRMIRIAAAAIILFAGIFSFLLWSNKERAASSDLDASLAIKNQDVVLPGTERARIILENGDFIDLDKIEGDTVIDNGSFEILKSADGLISYRMKEGTSNRDRTIFNTIVTPSGGEYNLKLPDGTRVWLNAMTSLRYPIVFDNVKREIYLKGEAYFEVTTQIDNGKRVPFIIHTGGQALEVLGTAFNLQNYGATVVTTLVEGQVKLNFVDAQLGDHYLKPAEQSVFHTQRNKVTKKRVDPYYFTAWKDGKFAFDKTSIEDVMAIISRWYDVDVVYHAKLENFEFSGTVSRYEDLRKLLKTIELVGGIHFEIEGRTIYVKK
jgi:transmembrane sensor